MVNYVGKIYHIWFLRALKKGPFPKRKERLVSSFQAFIFDWRSLAKFSGGSTEKKQLMSLCLNDVAKMCLETWG